MPTIRTAEVLRHSDAVTVLLRTEETSNFKVRHFQDLIFSKY